MLKRRERKVVRAYKKVRKSFVIFRNQSIFATRTMNRTSKSVRLLYDRLTSFDLVKSGKFTLGCRNGLVKSVMFLSRDTDCFSIICLTPGIFQNLTRASVAKVRACPFLYRPDKPNLITIKTLTAYAKIQNHNQTTEDEQRHHHRTRHVRRGLIH